MKNIVIIGAGQVGYHLAKWLSEEHDKNVVVIDKNEEILNKINEQLDVQVFRGDGSNKKIFGQAQIENADILIAVTNSDEINMISCLNATLNYNIKYKIARIRNFGYYNDSKLLSYLGINIAINPEKEASENILRLLKIPQATEIVEFEGGKVLLLGYKIEAQTPIVNLTLKDFRNLPGSQYLVIVGIVRNNQKMIVPRGNTPILPGDTIYIVTPSNQLSYVHRLLEKKESQLKSIMIIGGGISGKYLAQLLEKKINVKLVEKEKCICDELAQSLSKTVVLNTDPQDIELLKDENLEEMDALITTSSDEQMNILIGLLGKKLGISKTIAIVNNPDYVNLATSLGIDGVINPKLLAANSILKFIREGSLAVKGLQEHKAEAIEIILQNNSKVINKKISEINLPSECVLGAVVRDKEVIIPKGDTVLLPNDRLIIFTLINGIKKIEYLFSELSRKAGTNFLGN